MLSFARKLLGSSNDRTVRRMATKVQQINALEPSFQALDDEALKAKTGEFRARLEKGETVDQLLPEAFAATREAAKRALGERHYDVQLMGGMVLHEGGIAEMKAQVEAGVEHVLRCAADHDRFRADDPSGWRGPDCHV